MVGIVISIVSCIIFTYVPCNENNIPDSIDQRLCKVIDNNNFTYFDNFIMYFTSFNNEDSTGKFIRIFILILDSITYFFENFFYILVIKHLDPVNVTFCTPMFFILKKIILIINNLIINKNLFKDSSKFKPTRFFLDFSGDIICLIGFLIYFEILELNICGLNHNLKKYIIARGIETELPDIVHSDTLISCDEDDNSI